ncbi:replicative DNA helicase [Luteimonas sp. FXH3W]|uniref:DNA 5'-3' helicase n=1 Tax=Aquilutibacter rugosus TaxID=3115820 RepID=A0ABU7V0W2_9GAMM
MSTTTDAETAVLGACLLDKAAFAKVADWLSPDDFAAELHSRVFATIAKLAMAGKDSDCISVNNQLPELKQELQNGSVLVNWATNVMSTATVEAHAEIVLEASKRRKLETVARNLLNPTRDRVADTAFEASSQLLALTESRAKSAESMAAVGLTWWGDFQQRMEGRVQGLMTPWAKLNTATNGLREGQLIVMAARPGMGKSAFAINLATSAAMRGERCLLFSLEMSATEIFDRIIASLAYVPLQKILTGSTDTEELQRISANVGSVRKSPLLIDETGILTAEQICARARKEHLRSPLSIVIVDHLNIVKLSGKASETTELANATQMLKSLAKELKVPVLVLTQLNRKVEDRGDKRPQLSDLRGSGAIEQDADVVLLLYRPGYYDKTDTSKRVECIIAKQRQGEAGRAILLTDKLHIGLLDDCHDEWEPAVVSSRRRRQFA